MGSKSKHAKKLLEVIKPNKEDIWVEPFVGGGNLIEHVPCKKRIGSDANKYIIALLKEMQKEDFLAPIIDENKYNEIKKNKESFPEWLVAFASYGLSYGALWFKSYSRAHCQIRDFADEAKRNSEKQAKKIKDVEFYSLSYEELTIPSNAIIYCDPPYSGTETYKNTENFNHSKFWDWVREKVKKGYKVYVSEYAAPEDFICVWRKKVCSSLKRRDTNSKRNIEKLFVHDSQHYLELR